MVSVLTLLAMMLYHAFLSCSRSKADVHENDAGRTEKKGIKNAQG